MPGSGLIFAVLIVMWVAYLVPKFAAHRRQDEPELEADRFPVSTTVIRRTSDPFAEENNPDLEVSTPFTRAAARHEVRQSHRLAARRRLRVVLVLLGATLVTAVLAGIGHLGPISVGWGAVAVPAGLLAAFLGVARFSVVSLNKALDVRMRRIEAGWDEPTTSFEVPAQWQQPGDDHEHSIELSEPVIDTGSLWEPIPVTAPTYVSKPMVPRTVRTIDLSMPESHAPDRAPVVAERRDAEVPVVEETLSVERPRAVGE